MATPTAKTAPHMRFGNRPVDLAPGGAVEMPQPISPKVKVVVATTVMLSFINVWRAAAIVLSDLASSAYYAGGIAENTIGKAAPWFILGIMLFGFAIRAI